MELEGSLSPDYVIFAINIEQQGPGNFKRGICAVLNHFTPLLHSHVPLIDKHVIGDNDVNDMLRDLSLSPCVIFLSFQGSILQVHTQELLNSPLLDSDNLCHLSDFH